MNKRKVRGIQNLVNYLNSIGCKIGKSTIGKLIRQGQIPHIRLAERVLIFDLDEIDKWLNGDELLEDKEKLS